MERVMGPKFLWETLSMLGSIIRHSLSMLSRRTGGPRTARMYTNQPPPPRAPPLSVSLSLCLSLSVSLSLRLRSLRIHLSQKSLHEGSFCTLKASCSVGVAVRSDSEAILGTTPIESIARAVLYPKHEDLIEGLIKPHLSESSNRSCFPTLTDSRIRIFHIETLVP